MAHRRFEQLVVQLRDATASIEDRRGACRALACEIGDPRVDALLDMLRPDQPPELRFEVVYDLGQLGDARAFEPFCQIIRDRGADPALRGLAAELISNFTGVDAVPVLVEALGDREPIVRFDAAWSLGIVGDERATDALEAHVDDAVHPYGREPSIGDVARRALQHIAGPSQHGAERSERGQPPSRNPGPITAKRTTSAQRAAAKAARAPRPKPSRRGSGSASPRRSRAATRRAGKQTPRTR